MSLGRAQGRLVLAYRRLAKSCNFAQASWLARLRYTTLRRMDCGKWKAAGKTYRTRVLAELGARKRGLIPLGGVRWDDLINYPHAPDDRRDTFTPLTFSLDQGLGKTIETLLQAGFGGSDNG